jgi:hypothetical protein
MMATQSGETDGVCMACGGVTGRWGAVRVGDQPVRLNNAAVVARMCTGCGTIEMRGREAPAGVPATRQALGRELLDGFLRNVAEAVRAVVRALRDRYRGEKK